MLIQFPHYRFYLLIYLFTNTLIFSSNKYITDWGSLLVENQSLTIKNEEVLQVVNNHILYMQSIFGTNPKKPFKIIISNKQELSYNNIWSWSLGITIGNTVIIKDTSISHISKKRFMQVLRHELNHIYLNRLSNKFKLPRWFEEGFSMYYADESSLSNKLIIANNIDNRDMLMLNVLDLKFNSNSKEQFNFAYAYSQILLDFFINNYSELILIEIIEDIKSGSTFEDAFYNNTLLTINDYNIQVLNNIKSNFWWLRLMKLPSLLLILAPLLLTIGFIIVKIRNQNIIQKWNLEEKLEEIENNEI